MQKRTKFIIYCVIVTITTITLTLAITLSLKKMLARVDCTQTECGYVEGRRITVKTDSQKTRQVIEYLNIPYAVPPKGDLRWRAPVSLKKNGSCWKDSLKYNDTTIVCPQFAINGSKRILGDEDCLILNVWSPVGTKKRRLPVLVWFHGGGMVFGHSRTKGYHPDSQFAASMEVVVVTLNYRLGIFGFLSLKELWVDNSTKGEYGNYGIMDQILALEWVKNNIKNFRGDPNDVTIFGNSGGGTAVYSLLSASLGLAKGLFHKVIASSGVPNIHTSHTEANNLYRGFLTKTKCNNTYSNSTEKCLRNLDAKIVLTSSPVSNPWHMRDYEWQFPYNVPRTDILPLQVIDPIVIQYSPHNLLSILQRLPAENKPKLSILLGNMAQEPLDMFYPNVSDWKRLEMFVETRANTFKNNSYQKLLELYKNRTEDKFTPETITPYYIYSLMTGDVILSCATTQLAYNLSQFDNYKVFSYIGSQGINPLVGKGMPAMHTVDIIALFGYAALQITPSEADIELMKNLRSVFKNFINSNEKFEIKHENRSMEFYNSTVHVRQNPYHEEECIALREIGLLKHSWGNVGVWDS